MKTRLLVTFSLLFLFISGMNILKVSSQVAASELILNSVEVPASPECGVYDRDDEILDEISYYCNVHKAWCSKMGCVGSTGKCCDTRLLTASH